MGWKRQEMETQELAAHLERVGVSREPHGQTPLTASPEGQEQMQGRNKEAAGAPRRYSREGGSRRWWRERDECQSLAEVAE